MPIEPIRSQLASLLSWHDAHADFDRAVADVPAAKQGVRPPGLPYSLWELLEHIRIAQHDILDFCRNPEYQDLEWPADYWPSQAEPPSPDSWDRSVAAVRTDRQRLIDLVTDPEVDLYTELEHGNGQTILREVLLAVDHAAYHVGQMVLVRRLLDIWD